MVSICLSDLLGLDLGAQVDRPHLLALALQAFQPAARLFLGILAELSAGGSGKRGIGAKPFEDALGDHRPRRAPAWPTLALDAHHALARAGQRRLGGTGGAIGVAGLALGLRQQVGRARDAWPRRHRARPAPAPGGRRFRPVRHRSAACSRFASSRRAARSVDAPGRVLRAHRPVLALVGRCCGGARRVRWRRGRGRRAQRRRQCRGRERRRGPDAACSMAARACAGSASAADAASAAVSAACASRAFAGSAAPPARRDRPAVKSPLRPGRQAGLPSCGSARAVARRRAARRGLAARRCRPAARTASPCRAHGLRGRRLRRGRRVRAPPPRCGPSPRRLRPRRGRGRASFAACSASASRARRPASRLRCCSRTAAAVGVPARTV